MLWIEKDRGTGELNAISVTRVVISDTGVGYGIVKPTFHCTSRQQAIKMKAVVCDKQFQVRMQCAPAIQILQHSHLFLDGIHRNYNYDSGYLCNF